MTPLSFVWSVVLAASLGALLASCSSSATVSRMQTSNFYPTKIRAKALVYIAPELRTRKLKQSLTTEACSGWVAEVDAGNGYTTASFSGVAAAVETAEMIDTPPTTADANTRGAQLLISIVPGSESTSLTATEGSTYPTIAAQYQTSLDVTIANGDGKKLFTFAANGTGFHTVAGPCNVAASVLQTAIEMALKQVSDWIAQSVYGAEAVRRR